MHKIKIVFTILITTMLIFSGPVLANEVYRLRIFFGLSLPNGGAVSLNDWQRFQQEKIATTFEGFNVVDSTGYYKGKPERSKIVTVIVDEKGTQKAKDIAALYAKMFQQESVMIVKVNVLEWSFVEAK
ncbi:MAG: DUF3574 domain-containing protein [Desulfobacteraceae bacterium]|nr:DUF3574 domain-containing protein [Desulfobacteraceae bacterium]